MTLARANTSSRADLNIDGHEVYFTTSENMDFLPDHSVDLIVTSPPYWNLKDYGMAEEIGAGTYEDYLDRMTAVWRECYRVAKPDSVMVVNVANRRYRKRFYPIAFDMVARMGEMEPMGCGDLVHPQCSPPAQPLPGAPS